MTRPHRLPTPDEVASLDPIDITSLADWDPDEYTVHSPGNPLATQGLRETKGYNAMMLQEDQDKTIWFDCQESQQEYFFDAHTSMNNLKEELIPNNKTKAKMLYKMPIPSSVTLTSLDPFLKTVKEITLPDGEEYDVTSYIRLAMQSKKHVKPKVTKRQSIDPASIQACLAFLPLDKIKKTLECTTQLVKWTIEVPMQDTGKEDSLS